MATIPHTTAEERAAWIAFASASLQGELSHCGPEKLNDDNPLSSTMYDGFAGDADAMLIRFRKRFTYLPSDPPLPKPEATPVPGAGRPVTLP
jgi:hypothetical protein